MSAIIGMRKTYGKVAADEGFVPLFNGRDQIGWEGATAMYGVEPDEPGVLPMTYSANLFYKEIVK